MDLQLPENLSQRRGRQLAADVLAAVRAAQVNAAAEVQGRADDTFGADSPAATRMRQELTERFGEAPAGQ